MRIESLKATFPVDISATLQLQQLQQFGFTAIREDPRLFYPRKGDNFVIFSVHVDDLLMAKSTSK
jgi:hypothetical protein